MDVLRPTQATLCESKVVKRGKGETHIPVVDTRSDTKLIYAIQINRSTPLWRSSWMNLVILNRCPDSIKPFPSPTTFSVPLFQFLWKWTSKGRAWDTKSGYREEKNTWTETDGEERVGLEWTWSSGWGRKKVFGRFLWISIQTTHTVHKRRLGSWIEQYPRDWKRGNSMRYPRLRVTPLWCLWPS